MLEVGTKAPDFTLPDQNGNMHSLSGSAMNWLRRLSPERL